MTFTAKKFYPFFLYLVRCFLLYLQHFHTGSLLACLAMAEAPYSLGILALASQQTAVNFDAMLPPGMHFVLRSDTQKMSCWAEVSAAVAAIEKS